jgi:hypothetical protein
MTVEVPTIVPSTVKSSRVGPSEGPTVLDAVPQLGKSEIQQLRTVGCEHHVRRFQIAMHDTLPMRRVQCIRHIDRNLQSSSTLKRPFSRRSDSVCPSSNSMTI